MRRVDEAAHVVGPAVKPARGKEIHAVVAPSEPPRKIADGHHYNQRYSGGRQLRKLLYGCFPGTLLRKAADVHLINHLPFERDTFPRLIGPLEERRVDHL